MADVDDFQSFISAQKKRIEQERAGLVQGPQAIVARRDVGYSDNQKLPQDSNNTNMRRQEQPKATIQDVTSPSGLVPFGRYESVQQRLQKERAEEYKKFLAEKNYRKSGQNFSRGQVDEKSSIKGVLRKQDYVQSSPRDIRRVNHPSLSEQQRKPLDDALDERFKPRGRVRPEKTMEELYDAYEELLERKRQDEQRYRSVTDGPLLDPRRVRFDDESKFKPPKETWLENGSRRRWDTLDNSMDRVGGRRFREIESTENFQEKTPQNKNQNPEADRVSRSAPPQAIPLFGEHDMTPEKKQHRQAKYREELQAQMKEKEMQKKREKNHMFVGDVPKEEPSSKPINQDLHAQGYLPSYPRRDNPPSSTHLASDQPSGNPYLHQPYIYQAGLLSSGPSLSTFNEPSMLDRNPMSFREPSRGYQPSWANDPVRAQHPSGPSVGQTGDVGWSSVGSRYGVSTGKEQRMYGDFSPRSGGLPHGEVSKEKDRDRQQSYREELTRQMVEKEMRKKKDKEDAERYNQKLEREITEYNPWGKGGGGAPIKDVSGRLISDLRKMHQYNIEGTIISPRDHVPKPDLNKDLGGLRSDVVLPSASTVSKPVAQQDTAWLPTQTAFHEEPQKKSQLEYQDFLRQQVEEKQRKKKEEEERLRELDAQQDKIIEAQQRKLQSEYEKEIEAAKQKEEAARLKNENMREAAKQKKKEMDQKKLEEERRQEERLREQLDERLKAAKAMNTERSASPPIPSLQGQVRSNSPPIPTLQRKGEEQSRSSPPIPTLQSQVKSNSPPTLQQHKEKDIRRQTSVGRTTPRPSSSRNRSGQQAVNPPLPSMPDAQGQHTQTSTEEASVRRSSSVTADIDVLSQLTSLRRQLKHEEVKVKQQLTENKEKYARLRENSASRRTKKPAGNVFDNVLRKKPAVSQKDQDLKNVGPIAEFNQLKYEDTSSLHGDFISRYPDPATSSSTLELQQKSMLKEQQKRLQTFRDTLQTTDKENIESLGNHMRPASNTSQLESDSQFVSVEDPSKVVVGGPLKQSDALPSARERRRWKQLEQLSKSSKLSDYKPPTPGGFSMNSVTSFNVDELAQKNEERLRKLEAMKQARSESKGDPNEVLKKFIQQHSRPDSKISEMSLPADKRYLPNT